MKQQFITMTQKELSKYEVIKSHAEHMKLNPTRLAQADVPTLLKT